MPDIQQTVPAYFARALERFADLPILQDRQGHVTMREVLEDAAVAAGGLRAAGIEKGDRIGLYADNSRLWIVADLAMQLVGAVSVPRGTDTPAGEMAQLFSHAEVRLVFAHGARQAKHLEEVRSEVPSLEEIVCLDGKDAPGRTIDDLKEAGRGGASFTELAADARPEDLATIIYTSGTTGRPKGVMLTQANFAHQVRVCPPIFTIGPAEKFLSVLPVWHIFERTVEYIALTSGACLVYTNPRRFKEDMARSAPTFVPSVPRIWETVYAGVQKALQSGSPIKRGLFRVAYAAAWVRTSMWDRARGHVFRVWKPRGARLALDAVVRLGALLLAGLAWLPERLGHLIVFSKLHKLTGGQLRGAISGGGLMPPHVDRFFRTIGMPILVGYGLTETSPVVTLRRMRRNVLGTIGTALPEVEVQIRSADTGEVLGPGETGAIVTRGPHIMPGYYKDDDLTAEVIDADGWFDTGDLGFLTEEGDVCFRGRLKETIVLKGGENVEPGHVEAADYRLWVRNSSELYRVNVEGTTALTQAAADAGVSKIVYTSSVATLGLNKDGSPSDENTPVSLGDMIGHYKRSKYMAEQAVQHMIDQQNLPAIIVNPSTPIGPRDIKPTPTGRMVLDAACGRMPAYVDTGLNVAHVGDVAKGHLLAFKRGKFGERYVLGGEDMKLQQIFEVISQLSGHSAPKIKLPHNLVLPIAYLSEAWAWLIRGAEPRATVDGVRMSKKLMYFSSDKARRELGYATRPARDALADAIDWFLEHNYCVK